LDFNSLILAHLQIFSTRNPAKVHAAEEALSVPKFAAPWVNESSAIELGMQEELPLGHIVLCLPARNQLDGSLIKNVELEGSEYFKLNGNGKKFVVVNFLHF
jgi:hypothetical protein